MIICSAQGKPYETLPQSFIIFLCRKDWLGTGRPVAKFRTFCEDNKDIKLEDGCSKYFLSAEHWKKESDIETQAFLKYLYNHKATDTLTSEIDNKVEVTKLNEIFRNDYLSMNLHEHDIRLEAEKKGEAKGIEQNKITNAKALISLGKNTLEDIAMVCSLPLDQVKKLAEEIK